MNNVLITSSSYSGNCRLVLQDGRGESRGEKWGEKWGDERRGERSGEMRGEGMGDLRRLEGR